MGCLYVVRCNFSDPDALAGWEHWYSGEKQDWLLSRPGFIAGQRFSAVSAGDGVDYLALYALESPAALETPEYRSGWGWGEWRPYIVDWSRNFFDGVDPEDFLTEETERLQALFVDPSADAGATSAAHPDLTWAQALPGLDGTLAALGLARRPATGATVSTVGPGVTASVFRAASPARHADSGQPT